MATIAGKVVVILPEVSGENENGYWVRGGIVVAPMDNPGKRLAVEAVGTERVSVIRKLAVGQTVIVNFAVESHEYQDNWYTKARMLSVSVPQNLQGDGTGQENS